jgi:L-malate glycosyltransferase
MMVRELNWGGIERDVSKFARYLPANGVAPHVACFNPGGARWREIEAAGIPLLPLPIRSFRSKSALDGARTVQRYVREHGIGILHAFDMPSDIYGVPVGRMLGIPVTISSQLCYRELATPAMRLLLGVTDRLASALFVNCEAIAEHLVRDWRVARRRIHVCYNGVETREFHAGGRRRPDGLADADTVIGTVAVLREEKNLPMLLQAFATVWQRNNKVRLLLVGSGPLREQLQRQAEESGIRQACVFEEATASPAAFMRAMDIFVLPSRSEAFSNALLEAMACGCCPVGSRVGGTPELIHHETTGLLFRSGNVDELTEALWRLVCNAAERRRMGEAAAQFAHGKLSIEIAAARLAGIYRTLLG